ncbi:MAG: metallopeptidase [Verrucomicrobiae bacterium]|nr:metallopeptidase [Verrucomicrobiae bacterium]NNJ87466.1 metallopeptidase [Akkermansiaceae bacterium]
MSKSHPTSVCLLAIIAIACLATPIALADIKPSTQKQTKKIGWIEPVQKNIEGWTVDVDPQLISGKHKQLGTKALAMLRNHLQRISILVPKQQLSKLQQIGIWIEYSHPELGNMQYHPGAKWLVDHGYDPRLNKKVHITQAANLLKREQLLKHPAVILHELAHGYHDQFLTFEHKGILAAYKKAMAEGAYDNSLLYNGQKVRHYAATNHKEYFAEATEAYFYKNDFYPFVAAELKIYDPTAYALMQQIWGGRK